MAIKEKIPSPSEVAKSMGDNNSNTPQTPEQNKSNSEVKFSTEDIEKIQKLQSDTNAVMFQFGQLKVNQIKLEQQEKFLEQREEALGKELSSKYGIGTVNIEAGTFTPQAT